MCPFVDRIFHSIRRYYRFSHFKLLILNLHWCLFSPSYFSFTLIELLFLFSSSILTQSHMIPCSLLLLSNSETKWVQNGSKFNCLAFNKCWAELSQASGRVMRNVKLSACALTRLKIFFKWQLFDLIKCFSQGSSIALTSYTRRVEGVWSLH